MKRMFLVFSLAIIHLGSSGQPYIPLLGELTEWHTVSCLNGCGIDSYHSSGDTLIDNQHYQVLDGFHYIQGNFLIREDVGERKIYMKILAPHTLLDEYPLYDFSLEDGDTTHVYNPISPLPEDGGLFVVDSILSRTLETGDHRFFYLHAVDPIVSYSTNTVWVEGVGSLSLINSPGAAPTAENHLGCESRDGILQYANTDSISSCVDVSIPEIPDSRGIQIRPTLFTEKVEISLDRNTNCQLYVYSMSGNIVYRKDIVQESKVSVSSIDLPSGLLIFNVLYQDGTSFRAKAINLK